MATDSTPQLQAFPLSTTTMDDSPPFYALPELQMSPQRKPLPHIPITSPNERIQGSPVSPVKISFQTEDFSAKASSAEIEETDAPPYTEQLTSRADSPRILVPSMRALEISNHNRSRSAILLTAATGDENDPGVSDETRGSKPTTARADSPAVIQPVPPLQYHHLRNASEDSKARPIHNQFHSVHDSVDAGADINRRLTPNSPYIKRSTLQRPPSTMSLMSDFGPRSRSPGGNIPNSPSWSGRAPSANSNGRSADSRPNSFYELLNVPYPQAPPPAISFDNSQLRQSIGNNASLLSTEKTLELYRQNVKKTNDSSIQYAFAIYLITVAQEKAQTESHVGGNHSPKSTSSRADDPGSSHELVREARHILQKLSDKSYPFAQYYLADGYASGLFSKGKEDYNTAFPLFVAASKHGHAESGYRAALCYEFGWGCRKDPAKAVQFYRQSASKNHPGAMTRLGRACLEGDLGLNRYREGVKWLKRGTEAADPQYNSAPYHLGLLYETGYGDDIFQDEAYAAQLFTQAADLGHAEAAYRMGDAYEYGKLSCPRDPALSIHFYTCAAQREHAAAMMALCAWYIVGAPPVLDKDENEAYEWARRAAELGLTKAQYAMGYFTEMGIGCRRDPLEANVWYVKAAEAGDERAKLRLAAIQAAAAGSKGTVVGAGKAGKGKKGASPGDKDKECIVM